MSFNSCATYRAIVDNALREHGIAKRRVAEETTAKEAAERELAAITEAVVTAANVAQAVQQTAHTRIAAVVTRCLAAVFDDPYTFEINFEKKRGRTEPQLLFKRRGLVLEDPHNEAGGGVVDIAAFALRVAAVIMGRPRVRPVLLLDEPFRFVSEEYIPRVRELLEELSVELDLQIIMITHINELKCGTVIQL